MQLDLSSRKIRYLFCPHASVRSAWILKDIHAEKKIAYEQWWNAFFFDARVERPMMLPEPLRLLALLGAVEPKYAARIESFKSDQKFHSAQGKSTITSWPSHIATDLSLQVEPDVEYLREELKKHRLQRPYAILAPSSQWATKRWTNEGYSGLVTQLAERGLNVYLVGTEAEKEHCEQIVRDHHGARVEVRSLAGTSNLSGLHALMCDAEIVIANDSGPMHMAAVAGRPVVAIFGPTTLALGFRPWTDQSYVVQKNMNCRPCGKHGHNKCPLKTHDCMKKISVQEVASAVDGLLKKSHPAGAVSPSQTY